MCLECLRLGKTSAEYPMHKPDHAYYVYDNLDFPLLTDDWTASQEIRLIMGIMKCGLGNWTDISEQYLKQSKQPKECEIHYFSLLMQQIDKISYKSALIYRASKTKDKNDEHQLDPAQVKVVKNMVNEYNAMKQKEKEEEDREFGTAQQ